MDSSEKEKVYENNWEAQTFDQLAERITTKVKEIGQGLVTSVLLGVKRKLLKIYRKAVYNIC